MNDTLHNLNINRGSKEKLIDINNQEFIDFNSGLWNVTLGYNTELNQNLKQQFNKVLDQNLPFLDITSYTHSIYNTTAKKLLDFIGIEDYENIIYTNSGSETLEAALKIVNVVSNKDIIISFKHSYHGTFYGDMTISGLTYEFNDSQNLDTDNNLLCNFPESEEEEEEMLNYFKHNYQNIKAIFIEPVLGSAGIYFRSIGFYNNLISFCKKNDIIVVFDEVATGFYKTGQKLFLNHLKEYPDIFCLGKAINNGTLPAGALVINKHITEKLEHSKIEHMSTQNGNILSITSIYETLKFYEKYNDSLLDNVNKIEKLAKDIANEKSIDVRCIGTMIAVPVKSENLYPIINVLRDHRILVYLYINNRECGISLFPNINIDPSRFEKLFKFILKKLKKYE